MRNYLVMFNFLKSAGRQYGELDVLVGSRSGG